MGGQALSLLTFDYRGKPGNNQVIGTNTNGEMVE